MSVLNQALKFKLSFCLGVLAISFAGCNGGGEKKNGDDNGGGKKASQSQEEMLVGKWQLDVDGTVEQMKQSAKSDEDKKQAEGMKEMMAAMKMSVEFDGEGGVVLSIADEDPRKADYTVEDKGDYLMVNITGGPETPGMTKFTFEGSDKVIMEPQEDNGPIMVLSRAK